MNIHRQRFLAIVAPPAQLPIYNGPPLLRSRKTTAQAAEILLLLAIAPMTINQLGDQMGKSYDSIRRAVSTLYDRHTIERDKIAVEGSAKPAFLWVLR